MRAISATLVAAALVWAGGPPQQPQPRPTFRTEANYVRVDVYPTAGAIPVTDLSRDEFEVFEDGVRQKIDAFEHVIVERAGPQETRHEPNTVAESRAALENGRDRVFVVFLDLYHVEVDGSHNIRKPLVDTLNRVIGQDDLVGVMTPEMPAEAVTFARRTTTIEGMLSRYWTWGERDRISNKDPEDDAYAMCYPDVPETRCADQTGVALEMIDRRRERRTLDALEDLVRYLRAVRDERKAILVITDGWRLFRPNQALARPLNCHQGPGTSGLGIDPRTGRVSTAPSADRGPSDTRCERDRLALAQLDNEGEFRRILDEANRANASFYPVDPRGLVAFDEPLMRMNGVGAPPPPTPLTVDASRLQSRLESLRTLAVATDGVAVLGSNDLAAGLKRVVDDLTSYYLLGYYSTNGKLDGKFRAIKVTVKRSGVQVRARRGYLAATQAEVAAAKAVASAAPAPDGPAGAAVAESRAVEDAVASLNGTARDLPVHLQTSAGWTPSGAAIVSAVAELGPGEDWRGGGEADATLADASGASLASAHAQVEPGSRSFRVVLTPSTPLAPGDYLVRVRARSVSPTAIPVNETARFRVAAFPEPSGAILLRRGPTTGNKEAPTADVRFRRSDHLSVEVAVPSGEGSARLLDRNGKPLPLPVGVSVRTDPDGSHWQTARLTLAPLTVGDYVIELAGGADTAGGSTSRKTLVAFRIVP